MRLLPALALLAFTATAHAAPIRICAENDWAPFSFSQKGLAVGASVDLVRAAFKKAGVETSFISGSYNRCLRLTLAGQYDAMLDVGKNRERTPQFVWPQHPYLVMKLHLIANSKLAAPAELYYGVLTGKRVGLTAGYEYPDKMLSQPGLLKVESSSELANLRQLSAGNIEFMLLSAGTLATLSKQLDKAELKHIRDWGQIDQSALYIAFNPKAAKAQQWASSFDQGWQDMQKKGEDQQIFTHWSAMP
ncbi:ABC transporter substrate-binding protein [Chitinibacter sp. GC72]|uniref:substrate-binding periplasmic protein n=1 Tax=Chitinibacter sp. GC72 TaxID=1526917 RepID=UPI0012F9E1F4|nr:transporter substrate-binding domain-containing protein [Chitinibacter sp. GC72]